MKKERADFFYRIFEGGASAALALCVGFLAWFLIFCPSSIFYCSSEQTGMKKFLLAGIWIVAHMFFMNLATSSAKRRNPHRNPSKIENGFLFLSSFIPLICCGWLFKELELFPLFVLMIISTGIGSYIGIRTGNEPELPFEK